MRFSNNAKWPKRNLGHFRLSVSEDPRAFHREADRQIAEPWTKLAAAYRLSGNEAACARLLEAHPEAVVALADFDPAVRNWDQAIAEYGQALVENPESRQRISELRGRAFAALGQWEKAADDLVAALENDPSRPQAWLQLIPVLVLADDQEAYAHYCLKGLELIGGTTDPRLADVACKLSLLVPNVVDANKLPIDVVSKALRDESASRAVQPSFWACKALFAYRSGEFEFAIEFVEKSQSLDPNDHLRALDLSIQALSE